MIFLGVDLGDARTGIAISASGAMTRSYRLIEGKGLKKTAIEVAEIVCAEGAETVVIGNPINMDGTEGERSEKAKAFRKLLEGQLFARGRETIALILMDERLTTVEAHQQLSEQGYDGKERKKLVDMKSAELILQSYLTLHS